MHKKCEHCAFVQENSFVLVLKSTKEMDHILGFKRDFFLEKKIELLQFVYFEN